MEPQGNNAYNSDISLVQVEMLCICFQDSLLVV